MIDLTNPNYCPVLEEISQFVRNPLFDTFCSELKARYNVKEKVEFSKCSWEYGWNIKFKKSGKSLCTIYPRENYFTVLVVVGKQEKETVELLLPNCTLEIQEIYRQTKEGNGQKWLMIDLEDEGKRYEDVFCLIEVRATKR